MCARGRNETAAAAGAQRARPRRDRASSASMFAWVSLDALRRPGRARRVDQRQRRRRARPRARRASKSKVRARPRSSASCRRARVDQDDVARCPSRRDALGERALGDRDPVAGVAEQVARSARRRARVVDAERRRAELHRREVDDVELGPVDASSAPTVSPRRTPSAVQPARRPARPRRAAARRSARRRAVRRAHRDCVAAPGRRDLERLAQRARVEAAPRAGAAAVLSWPCDRAIAGPITGAGSPLGCNGPATPRGGAGARRRGIQTPR